jgi:hypothetical protein
MFAFDQLKVNQCVRNAVPHISDHIINKATSNEGFSTYPMAIHPITKLLTLNLDNATRFSIENELIDNSGLNSFVSQGQIKFILSCYSTLSFNLMIESIGVNKAEELWSILNNECYRDGCLFLEYVSNMENIDLKETAERFIAAWSV